MGSMAEFQAVLLAGGTGSRITQLTEDVPKPILPIANRPMVWYSLRFLENAGFSEVLVLVRAGDGGKSEVVDYLKSYEGKIYRDIHVIEGDKGTADALRDVRDKIKTDFIVVSSDLITDVDLQHVADVHRINDATVTALVCPRSAEAAPDAGKKKATADYGLKDYVGLDESGKRLLFFAPQADVEEALSIRKSVLKRHPLLSITTNLADAHLYIFKRWVLDFLADKRGISAVKGELVPYLVRKQFAKRHPAGRPAGCGLGESGEGTPGHDPTSTASVDGNPRDAKIDLASYALMDELDSLVLEMSSSHREHHGGISCFVHTLPPDRYCARANTLASYAEINKQIPRHLAFPAGTEKHASGAEYIHPSAKIDPKTQIGNDCVIGEQVRVGERCSVKRSVVGRHCTIGADVKIANSIIMDYVSIKEGCNISGSIVCPHAVIDQNCSISNSQIGRKYAVAPGSKITNECVREDKEYAY